MKTYQEPGVSENTPAKQESLRRIAGMLCGMWSNIGKYGTKLVVDAMAGNGSAHLDPPGSAITLSRFAKDFGMQFYAIEQNPESAATLTAAIGDKMPILGKVINASFIDAFRDIPFCKYNGGLIYFDPNGVLPDAEGAARFLNNTRFDILISIAGAGLKRVEGAQKKRHGYVSTPASTAHLREIFDREHWYVRKPIDKHQWTFLLGTQTDKIRQIKSIGFVHEESEQGQEYLTQLDYTSAERAAMNTQQLPLL